MSVKSQCVPCGELIEGGDKDNPPSEQQPWLTIAKHVSYYRSGFSYSPAMELESTGASFSP